MAKSKYVTFLDEAGNTGKDLTNDTQPFFVMSAIMIPEDKVNEFTSFLVNEFNRVKEKEETEIKGVKWCKAGAKKQGAIKNLIGKVDEGGGHAFVIVLEKHYMIAGRLVQTFFDGEENCTHCNLWNNDKGLAVYCANKILGSFTYQEMDEIGILFSKPTESNFIEIIKRLKNKLTGPIEQWMLDESLKYVGEIAETNVPSDGLIGNNVEDSPNITVFNAICEFVAKYCKDNNCQTDIIFDNCLLCNNSFKNWIENGQSRADDLEIKSWNATLYKWNDRIMSFTSEDSKDNKLLQIADVLSSSINHALITMQNGKTQSFDSYIISYMNNLLNKDRLWSVMSNNMNKQVFN